MPVFQIDKNGKRRKKAVEVPDQDGVTIIVVGQSSSLGALLSHICDGTVKKEERKEEEEKKKKKGK